MINRFFVFGINHHHAETSLRGLFAAGPEKQEILYTQYKQNGFESVIILNTCNRMEIYGMGNAALAREIYFSALQLDAAADKHLFHLQGNSAIQHLFEVAAGLNSKVIGDLEILGQVKDAFHKAKSAGMLNGYTERLANAVTQSAKEVRHETELSNGSTSLAYSVVKYLHDASLPQKPKILLIGAGSFAKNISQNITDYLQHAELFITNRTFSRAEELAQNFNATAIAYNTWRSRLAEFDIVISAIHCPEHYILTKEDASHLKHTYLLDLAVPYSMEPGINQHVEAFHLTVDELSKVVNHTLECRKTEIPLAKEIIGKNMLLFCEWSSFYEKSDSLKDWKKTLYQRVDECPFLRSMPREVVEKYIQKSMSHLAQHIKTYREVPQDKSRALAEFLQVYHASEIAAHLQTQS